jgi:hypothetical protein
LGKESKKTEKQKEMKLTTEDLSRIISEELEAVLDEKKGSKRQRKKKAKKKKAGDRCTRIAKRKYDVWPSAYASGAVVQCRRGKIWKGLKEEDAHPEVDEIINEEELTDKEKAKLRDILIDQGGAGSLGNFKDKIDKPEKDIKKAAKDDPKITKHRHGDYILKEEEVSDDIKSYIKDYAAKYDLDLETPMAGYPRKPMAKRWTRANDFVQGLKDRGASWPKNGYVDYITNVFIQMNQIEEAVYRGRKVKLNKPMRGDVKKFKVYVNSGKKDKEGRVLAKKVNFGHGGTSAKKKGEKTMKIRKSNPKARKNFRARHNCDNPGPKTKARYWSCRKW